nr:hypothetical protein [Tanacetum cinerariifolium]
MNSKLDQFLNKTPSNLDKVAGVVGGSDGGRVGCSKKWREMEKWGVLEIGGKHCAVHSVSNVGVTGKI